jgi:hypothetical protein
MPETQNDFLGLGHRLFERRFICSPDHRQMPVHATAEEDDAEFAGKNWVEPGRRRWEPNGWYQMVLSSNLVPLMPLALYTILDTARSKMRPKESD